MKLSPAAYVIYMSGGIRPAARAIGRDDSRVCRWQQTGQIPSGVRKAILKVAKDKALDITSEDLDFGRSVRTKKGYLPYRARVS